MPDAASFDLGPLSWVQAEIDQALAKGLEALAQFKAAPGEGNALKHARAHVHQAAGAIQMVGLDAVVAYTDELERQLLRLEDLPATSAAAACDVLDRAGRKLRIFLDEIVNGAPPVPLKLYPEYEAMQVARGVKAAAPTDLFYPDLSPRAPRLVQREPVPAGRLPSLVVKQRRLFQRGLLAWLRGDEAGATTMRDAVTGIEDVALHGPLRAFWWTVGALLEALDEKGLDAGFGVKQLMARVDLQIRRVAEGSGKVADRLRREVLYYVAISAPVGPQVQAVQRVFRLSGLIPSAEVLSADVVRLQPILREAREQLAGAKDAWLKAASGRAENLPKLKQTLASVHAKAAEIHHGTLMQLTAALVERLDRMPSSGVSEPMAMEYATALLLAESAFENFSNLSPDFHKQVEAMLARLDAVQHGRLATSGGAPLLDEMSKRAQERVLLAQVGREIQVNLRHMEQVLDAFFRDHGKRAELATLAKDSAQIRGALRILGLDEADRLLALCEEQIASYADPDAAVSDDDLELLAESLSGLGFYVEAVEQQRPDRDRLLRPLIARRLGEAPEAAPAETDSVEAAVAEMRAALPHLIEEVRAAPADAAAREALAAKLSSMRDDAELIGDADLVAQIKEIVADLEAGDASRLAAAASAIADTTAPAPEISDETQRLLATDASQLDRELLEIYLFEATEVLDGIDRQRELLRENLGDREALRVVRRGFHTLKGSGRMVGLTELGEYAYETERIFNRLLEEERPVTAAVMSLIAVAHQSFREWVDALTAQGRVVSDPRPLRSAIAAVARELPGHEPGSSTSSLNVIELPRTAAPAAPAAADPSPPTVAAVPGAAPPLEWIELSEVGSGTDVDAPAPIQTDASFTETIEMPALPDDGLGHVLTFPGLDGSNAARAIATPVAAPAIESFEIGGLAPEALAFTDRAPDAPDTGAVPEVAAPTLDLPPIETAPAMPVSESAGGPDVPAAAVAPDEALATQAADAAAVAHATAEEVTSPAVAGSAAPAATPAEEDAMPPSPSDGVLADASDEVVVGDVTLSRALWDILRDEAEQHLATLVHELSLLQFDPQAVPRAPMVRASHTLCGIHRTGGFPLVATTAKSLEQTLAALEQNGPPMAGAVYPVLARAVAGLTQLVGRMKAHAAFTAADVDEAQAIQRELDDVRAQAAVPGADAEVTAWLATDREAEAEAEAEAAVHGVAVPSSAAPDEPAPEQPDAMPEAAAPTAPEAAPTVPAPRVDPLADIRDDVDAQVLPIFLDEASELLAQAGTDLRGWRQTPDDVTVVARLRRTLHTFKGSARMAGAMRLGQLAHLMETRLEDDALAASEVPFDVLDEDFDHIAFVLDALRRGEVDVPLPWVAALARDLTVPEADVSTAPPVSADDTAAPAALPVTPERPVVVPIAPHLAPATAEPAAAPAAAAQGDAADADAGSRAQLRVRADVIDRLVNEAGEVAIARARVEVELQALKNNLLELTGSVVRLRTQMREIEIQGESQIQSHTGDRHTDFDPLEFDRYTRFQELTRSLSEGINDVATAQQSLLKNLDDADAALLAQARLSRDVQQRLFAIRTVPFGSLSERLYRILRTTARELGKRANLEIVGSQVELDRSVLEKLVGPLEHLLRNALDHGIEPRDVRRAAGKSETGEIRLTVRQVGNEVIIELADDGGGVDLERVAQRARSLGLLADDAQPTDAQLLDFLFVPGFSTAAKVTQISGRGIGMDVVRSEISTLGGRVDALSQRGQGTRFVVTLPLTLAVAQAVLVRAGARLWALPAPMVEQVQQVKSQALLDIYIERKVEWQGREYPFHYLPRLLGDTAHNPETKRHNAILLLRSGQAHAAIHVDEMIGNQELVVKNIGPQLARVSGISGATVLGTGEIVLIINPVALAARADAPKAEPHREDRALADRPRAPVVPVSTQPIVMIVDDSLTVRKVTSRLLAREGFAVTTARDGVDGLQVLAEQIPDVILLDIEMPRMDGFEFAKTIKGDPKYQGIPIIMITSRTAEKHRTRAAELGVDLYLGKPYQEDELLGHLREMTGVGATA
ncbi:MAG: Hpt domain-containing protein [Burkholderiales bacterium]|nr:Hpt domain-containing protein [Burkholderiales bacterium]